MSVIESIRVALQGLAANKLRSSLTMLGIIIGVGAVIALLALGEGTQAAITEEIQSIGSNLITVIPGRLEGQHGPGGSTSNGIASLTLADAEAIAAPGNVFGMLAVVPEFNNNADVVYGDENVNVNIKGTTSDYLVAHNSSPEIGEFLTEQHNTTVSRVAVLGHQTAEDLFGDDDPIGRTIKINRVHFRVIGVMEEEGGGMGFSADEVVFIPLTTAYQKLFGGRATSGTSWEVSSIAVTLASEDYMDAAVDDIT